MTTVKEDLQDLLANQENLDQQEQRVEMEFLELLGLKDNRAKRELQERQVSLALQEKMVPMEAEDPQG